MSNKFVLAHAEARRRAVAAVVAAPDGYRVVISEPRRSTEQSDKLHAMIGDIVKQKQWHGERLSSEEWKRLFSAAVFREKMLPGIEGGIVIVPRFTRAMNKKDMSDLIEFIYSWGAENGIEWTESVEVA
jgi:hypothetical protein